MADYPQRFTDTVIAEMRGVIDQNEQSPFWEGTVRHFFDMDFTRADYLSTKDKGFIADLMPKYPIYIPLLRDSAIEVIGKVHDKTLAALKFLETEGFTKDGHVDIFDAGPRIACQIKEIKTVKNSRIAIVENICKNAELEDHIEVLTSNAKPDYRVARTKIAISSTGVSISESLAQDLQLSKGEELRYIRI
jgi:arginine N-succinyltransferase